jgi:hypothetical protein
VPAAGHQITEERGPGSFLIKMKHLRIELGRKGLDLLFIESMRSAHKSLTHLQILQVKAASRTRIASGSHRISVHSISPMSRQRAIFKRKSDLTDGFSGGAGLVVERGHARIRQCNLALAKL